MANLGALKKGKVKKGGKLAALKAKKVGKVNSGPETIGIDLPAPDLSNPWAKKKATAQAKQAKLSDKQDYAVSGLKVGTVREHDGYWTVELVNGDKTYRFDDRFGSWMIHPRGFGESAIEARADIVALVHARWMKEIDRQKRKPGYLMHNQDHPKEKKEKEPAKPKPKKGSKGKAKPWGAKKK